jgi:hypothetical protein
MADSLQTQTKKTQMIKLLEQGLGNVSVACNSIGMERSTHYDWMKNDEAYREAVTEIKEYCIDYVEGKLFENIKDRRETSIIFYLKTQAKHRGYVEKNEFSLVQEQPIMEDFEGDVIDLTNL